MRKSFVAVIFAVLGLTGCGSMRVVDSTVSSYAAPPHIPLGASYRFERLPSQQAQAPQQSGLERIAQQALAKVGLKRNDVMASYGVEVSAGMKIEPRSPWADPWPGFNLGWNLGWGTRGGGLMIGGGWPFMRGSYDSPYYWRQVSVIIRRVNSSQVVYETHASHDGPWPDSDAVLPAMFDAALKDFPRPPQGPRRVNIEIPR